VSDPDAMAYLQAVEVADNQALEQGVQQAVNQFVIGCKADGIWDAIKASCILAGARTRLGALVPLKGTAPTSFNFVDGDYNRKTGLVGNGTFDGSGQTGGSKYLAANRANNADPQNSNHNAVYATDLPTTGTLGNGFISVLIAAEGIASTGANLMAYGKAQSAGVTTRSRSSTATTINVNLSLNSGLIATSRSNSGNYTMRQAGANTTISVASDGTESSGVLVFRRGDSTSPAYTGARLAFYSIGESLNLALLDARVTALINAFDAAITP
jgi:hypothetical protein